MPRAARAWLLAVAVVSLGACTPATESDEEAVDLDAEELTAEGDAPPVRTHRTDVLEIDGLRATVTTELETQRLGALELPDPSKKQASGVGAGNGGGSLEHGQGSAGFYRPPCNVPAGASGCTYSRPDANNGAWSGSTGSVGAGAGGSGGVTPPKAPGNPETRKKAFVKTNSPTHLDRGCYQATAEAEYAIDGEVVYVNRVRVDYCTDVTYKLKKGCKNGLKPACRLDEGAYLLSFSSVRGSYLAPKWDVGKAGMTNPDVRRGFVEERGPTDGVVAAIYPWKQCGDLGAFFGRPYDAGREPYAYVSALHEGRLGYYSAADSKPKSPLVRRMGVAFPAGVRVFGNGGAQVWGLEGYPGKFPGILIDTPEVPAWLRTRQGPWGNQPGVVLCP